MEGGKTVSWGGKAAGNRGEAETARYLRARGYALLASQWLCRLGEIDLVARDRDGTVCFVEVKLRSGTAFGLPREAVDLRKQRRLRQTAELWLSLYAPEASARFDVAEVYERPDGTMRVEYLSNAFE